MFKSQMLLAVPLLALALSLAAPVKVLAEEGVRGRASLGGTLVEKIEVRAYEFRSGTFGPLTGERVVAKTETGTDGSYFIGLPPGRYVIEAIKKRGDNKGVGPEPGDYYCLYSNSPVMVAKDKKTTVGLYMVEVPKTTVAKGEFSRIHGKITFQGKPVERVYLYAYSEVVGEFRGPASLLQPVASGDFSVRLPPGKYYLVARKRMRGGPYGPIGVGDLFNFYIGNPLVLGEGEEVGIELPLVERLSQLEVGEGDFVGLKVKIVDGSGAPVKGSYVLAYSDPMRVGPPSASVGPTDESGEVEINFPQVYKYLRIRQTLGGPLSEGEVYADAVLGSPDETETMTIELKAK